MNFSDIKTAVLAVVTSAFLLPAYVAATDKVVILHTNDTHSQIDPTHDGRGGVASRKAVIDSVRCVEPLTLLVDAGDAVQGTLYFTLFGGEVEQMVLNELGYDVQILGNHEFDNGMQALAKAYSHAVPTPISSNYNLNATPLKNLISHYVVKQIGDRRIGFIGLNINPEGLISYRNATGVAYNDALEIANKVAAILRQYNEVDAVVAVSHIGYSGNVINGNRTDREIASLSRGIDVIIGGHSHTDLRPEDQESTLIANLDGDSVLVVQNAGKGVDIGQVELFFDDGGKLSARHWKKYSVDSRLDDRLDKAFISKLAPYRTLLDSIGSEPVAILKGDFTPAAMLNFMADFVYDHGCRMSGKRSVDLAIVNKGGIRQMFVGDTLTAGLVISTFPFENNIMILEVKGSDLLELFDIMARQKGNGVSRTVHAIMSTEYTGCDRVTINGKPVDPSHTYRVATLDYLAGGGDNMTPLKKGKIVKESQSVFYEDILSRLRRTSPTIIADDAPRMVIAD